MNHPVKLFFSIVILTVIGFIITVVLPFGVDLHGKFIFSHPPENPLVLKGHEVYLQEGCQYCHTLNIRSIKQDMMRYMDLEKYGFDPSIEPDEVLFFAPHNLGSQRIGPDLLAISSKYSREELENLLIGKIGDENLNLNKYHNYGYLFVDENLHPLFLSWKIRWMLNTAIPFSDPYQRSVFEALHEKTKGDALIEFLYYLGKRKQDFHGKFYQ